MEDTMFNLRDNYVTAKEVAYSFGYSNIKSFYNAVNAGRFPVKPVVFGKRWYFKKDAIESLMEKIMAA
jgi:predicted DNA-binding transcriptional regulator AlpA